MAFSYINRKGNKGILVTLLISDTNSTAYPTLIYGLYLPYGPGVFVPWNAHPNARPRLLWEEAPQTRRSGRSEDACDIIGLPFGFVYRHEIAQASPISINGTVAEMLSRITRCSNADEARKWRWPQ